MEGRSLLPQILDLLSRQPTLSADFDDLCKALEPVLLAEHIAPFDTLRRAVELATDVGVRLGILSLEKKHPNFLKSNARDKKKRTSTPYKGRKITMAKGKPRAKVTKAKAKAKANAKPKTTPRGDAASRKRQCKKRKAQVRGRSKRTKS